LGRPLPEELYGYPVIGDVARWLNDICQHIQDSIRWLQSAVWNVATYEFPAFIRRVQDFFRAVGDEIVRFIRDPLGYLREAFSWIYSKLPSWVQSIFDWFWRVFYIVGENIISFFRDPFGYLKGIADRVWQILPDWLRNALDTVKNFVLDVSDKLKGFLDNPLKAVEDLKNLVWSALPDWLKSWWKNTLDTVQSISREMPRSFTELGDKVLGWVNQARDRMVAAFDGLQSELGKVWDGFKTDFLSRFAKPSLDIFGSIANFFLNLPAWIYNFFVVELPKAASAFASYFSGANLVSWMRKLSGESKSVSEFFVDIFSPLVSLIESWKKNPPENVTEALNQVITTSVSIGAAAEMATLAFELQAGHKHLGLGGAMGAALLSAVTDTVMATAIGGAVSNIMDIWLWKHLRWQFRGAYPGIEDALKMWIRGLMGEERLDEVLGWHGLETDFAEGYKQLAWYYPSVSDMIRFFVREAIPEVHGRIAEMKLQDMPPEMIEYAKKAGIPENWTKAFWAAHWVLPSVEQVYRMLQRGLVSPYTGRTMTREDVATFLKESDVDPRWRDNLIELSYDLPGRIEARWGLEWGIWDEAKFSEFLRAQGLHPDWIPTVVNIEKKNVFREHLNAVMSAAKRAFQRGFMTREQYVATLSKLGYPKEVQELRAWEADILQDIELREDILKEAITQFRADQIDEAQLRNILSSIIVVPEKLEQIVKLEVALKQKRAIPKVTVEEQIAALERRRAEIQRKLLDLDSDLEQARKIRDAELAIWEAKIARQKELIEMAVKPEQKEKLQLQLEIMLRQYERAKVYHANKIAELEETINFARQDLEAVESQIEALKRSIAP
jgi:hypothetical protein